MDIKKITQTMTRAYETRETQYGWGSEMTFDQMQAMTDLTEDQIRQGHRAIAERHGDLGVAGGVIRRF